MQLLSIYLRRRAASLLAWALFCGIFGVTFALYRLPLEAVLYPALLCTLMGALFLARDFARVRRKYRQLTVLAEQASALQNDLPTSDSFEEDGYQAIVRALQKELADLETASSLRYRDMVDYYTVWAHQIKTPIAAMRLTLQNEDTSAARRLSADLFRIEQYVGMVLAFLRLDSPSSDYVFRTHELDVILRQAAKNFAGMFIDRHIRLDYAPVGVTLVTDETWFSFVVEQLLSNALKYTPDGGSIQFHLEAPKTLCIADTGIGIAPEDLPRIFEKGYTGYNGRREGHASGLGLYLCKRVCENLGIGIQVTSEPGQGTVVRLDLAQADGRKE